MTLVPEFVGRLLALAAFAVLVGYFSNAPAYRSFPADAALVKLSLSHAGARKVECRRFTPEEIAALAPNMRRPLDCPRERVALRVELDIDGHNLYAASVPPSASPTTMLLSRSKMKLLEIFPTKGSSTRPILPVSNSTKVSVVGPLKTDVFPLGSTNGGRTLERSSAPDKT